MPNIAAIRGRCRRQMASIHVGREEPTFQMMAGVRRILPRTPLGPEWTQRVSREAYLHSCTQHQTLSDPAVYQLCKHPSHDPCCMHLRLKTAAECVREVGVCFSAPSLPPPLCFRRATTCESLQVGEAWDGEWPLEHADFPRRSRPANDESRAGRVAR